MSNDQMEGHQSLVDRVKKFLRRTTTIGQTLPPYLLIGLLFLIQQRNEVNNNAEQTRAALIVDFDDCVSTGRARIANRDTQYDLYNFIREQGPQALDFANELQRRFDARYQKNLVQRPEDCLELSEFKGKFTVEDFPPER